MTVINKLSQTLESIKGAESQCRTFSQDTDDPNGKLLFNQIADNLKTCESMFQNRVNYVESQEPQYNSANVQQQIQQQAKMQNHAESTIEDK